MQGTLIAKKYQNNCFRASARGTASVHGLVEQVFTNVVIVANPHSKEGARLHSLGILQYGSADAPKPPSDVPGAAYFLSTGHNVLAAFKTYYDLHGGEKIFGEPITEAFLENGTLTQYFENIALVWRPDEYNRGISRVTPKELGMTYAEQIASTSNDQPNITVENTDTDFIIHAWATLPFALPRDQQEVNVLVMNLQSRPITGAATSIELET